MADITERLEKVAVYLAALGRASGDTRWEAAELMREAATEIKRLQEKAWMYDELCK